MMFSEQRRFPGEFKKRHLHEQVSDSLRDAVLQGRFPSAKLPTETELANNFGVSLITIRKALETLADEKLIVRRQGSGTYIREKTRRGRGRHSRKTRLFCYLCGTGAETSPGSMFNRLMLYAMAAAEAKEYCPVVVRARQGNLPMPLARRKVDGAILAGTFFPDSIRSSSRSAGILETNEEYVRAVAACGFPVVTISNYASNPSAHRVLPDYESGFALALRHLLERGHRKIGLVAGPLYWPPFADRHESFLHAARKLNAEIDPRHVLLHGAHSYMDRDRARHEIRALLELTDRPSALLVSAGGPLLALQAAEQAGLNVPRDLSIVAVSDVRRPEAGEPMSSSVDQAVPHGLAVLEMPVRRMAETAVERMLKLVDSHEFNREETTLRLPLDFKLGDTVAAVQ